MSGEIQIQTTVDSVIRDEGSLDDDLSDVELEEEDRSSSLSEIEDKDAEQELDDDAEASDDLSNPSDDNDSEAETERLEESPHKLRVQKDVVLNSQNGSETYERSPSKLQKQMVADELCNDGRDGDALSDDDISAPDDSPESSSHEDIELDQNTTTAATSLNDSSGEGKRTLSTSDIDSRKRKRSIMAGSGLDDDMEEPLPKRTGSVMNPGDEYAIEDEVDAEKGDTSNPISGNISGEENEEPQEDVPSAVAEEVVAEDEMAESVDTPISPKKRGRKKKKVLENGMHNDEDLEALPNGSLINGGGDARHGEDDNAENEGDDEEAELALRNEEELEKKMNAFDQLGGIEKNFAVFRDRLYDERLEQMNREEAMLRQDQPTHPEFLAMMGCIEARRDERIRIAEKLREFELQTLKTYAVARRSQILTQYRQDAREIRERKMEQLGKQWYEIQHERRTHPSGVPDYTLNYPTRRSQQIQNQVAYANEVSILSGIAKHVGFPAAPPMAQATAVELEDDFERMGQRTRHPIHQPASLQLHELAALRTAGSTSRFKPAEEQFIEQTPWANPQHPSHAHLIQRQTSAQHTPRTTSPLSQVQVQPRRHSHQQGGGPISGTFSNAPPSTLQHTNGYMMSGGRVSPHNPFSNSTHSHAIAPSPLGSRQPSLSPKQTRPPPPIPQSSNEQQTQQQHLGTNNQNSQVPRAGLPDGVSELAREPASEEAVLKRELVGRF
ncbi:Transcriptional regulatory DEP1 protein [Rutstroemia sp. NJR-2017a WRK4]|nr:Transcriptional regulatory DEP1 protein [Rutstroemia sp. NJR-2017a WRK4]